VGDHRPVARSQPTRDELRRFGRVCSSLLVAATLTACSAGVAGPAETVTVTESQYVAVTVTPSPQYGLQDPELDRVLAEVCAYVADNEPSWDSMQEYGPFEEFPMQADMVALAGRTAEQTYSRVFKLLNYGEQAYRGNTLYGSVYTDISNRASLAMSMRSAAEDYVGSGSGYQRLYYFWAAYAASIESGVSGCSAYN